MLEVLVAGPPTFERIGAARVIEETPELRIVGTADLDELVQSVAVQEPDVLVIVLPCFDHLPSCAIGRIKKRTSRTGILLVSPRTDRQAVIQMINAGADGHVALRADSEQFVEAIRVVGAGNRHVCPCCRDPVVEKALDARRDQCWPEPHDQLTDREREILELVRSGETSREIAERLCISARTVEKHVENAQEKLGLNGRGELLRYLLARSGGPDADET